MKFTATFVSVALVSLAAAQNSNSNNALGIQAIEAHFTNAGIVPALLADFDPVAVMSLSYSGVGDISPGQALTKDQVAPVPNLTVTPANSTVQLEKKFTLVMADAGPVGTDESQGQTRHWLVNGVSLTGSTVSADDDTAITKYGGPAPPEGSGAHRYVILLYNQPDSFTAPDDLNTPNVPISSFDLNGYVKLSGLGAIVAGTYITVEEGTATASPSPTSPVVTSTLPAAQSSSSATGSSSASSSTAPAPSGSGGSNSNGVASLDLNIIPVASMLLAGVFGLGFVLF